jgi:bifunctional DNase/RNase
MYNEMTVYGFTFDNLAQMPVVILKDAGELNSLPVWISSQEAVSIASELLNQEAAAANGQGNLLARLLERMEMTVGRISIDAINDGVFAAAIRFVKGEEEILLEVRPSEALLAALKFKLPVFVAEEVIAHASQNATSSGEKEGEVAARRFIDFLEHLKPADLGKYPM